jgi:NAD(P)-dependent dehydrogenase (short-subunit alcohol dehydrogenase family)
MPNSNPPHPAFAPGRVAVITGAANGIGRAAALKFATFGMRLCLVDRDEEALTRTAAEVTAAVQSSDYVLAVPTDVSSADEVDRLARTVFERFVEVAVLMNNAGIGGGGNAFSNPDGWTRVIGVNLMGVVNGVQQFVPEMIKQRQTGLVIHTGSKQGITTPPGDTAYNVSKAGVKVLTEGLAHSLRNLPGCRITAHLLIPGFTYTGMVAAQIPEKPPAAWTPDQVVERLVAGIAANEFYILCEDNETTRAQDERRIAWAAGDIIHNRPALSRWHPDYKAEFERWMAQSASAISSDP